MLFTKKIFFLSMCLSFLLLQEDFSIATIDIPPVAVSETKDEAYLMEKLAFIRRQVVLIEHQNKHEAEIFRLLIQEADQLAKDFPDRAEPLIWKAAALSVQAKNHAGITSLSNVRQAKKLLERSLEMNENAADAAGYNILAILYYKVPVWPISFGNDEKAEEYFQKALSISSNLDTNYRYGEFLIEQGNREEGVMYLQKAFSFPNRPGRPEDVFKKQDIQALINAQNE